MRRWGWYGRCIRVRAVAQTTSLSRFTFESSPIVAMVTPTLTHPIHPMRTPHAMYSLNPLSTHHTHCAHIPHTECSKRPTILNVAACVRACVRTQQHRALRCAARSCSAGHAGTTPQLTTAASLVWLLAACYVYSE